jgi:hypothetical protein
MVASSLAPNPARKRAPACLCVAPPRQPFILWPPVAAAVVGCAALVVALFVVIPPRQAPAGEPSEEASAALPADPGQPELVPAPQPIVPPLPPAPQIAAAVREPQAASPPPRVEPNAFVSLPQSAARNLGCQHYRTAVDFFDSPAVAIKNAVREEKLVFVLHVAGNFEEPGFT